MKINAFTLMEVTVAMVVSAICITVCLSAYSIVSRYYSAFLEKNEVADRAMGLKQVLEKDFFRSQLILKDDTGLVLDQDTLKIKYLFKDQMVLREVVGLHTDTFKLLITLPETSFERIQVMEPDTIDKIHFQVKLDKGQICPIVVYKSYSAQNLFH